MREETVRTGRDNRLHGRLWCVEDDARGAVIIVHGLGDHGGRYRDLAAALTDHRWNVFAFDLMGHGMSPGSRGRIDRYDAVLTDIAHACQTVGRRQPGADQVILGHSMGGNLALNYVLRRNQFDPVRSNLAGLVLCGPMLLPPSPPPRPHIFAAWLTGRLLPRMRIAKSVDPERLTQDPERAEAIRRDPMTHSQISIYLATQLLSQGRWALDHARSVDVPTLIMHGEDDELIDQSACENVAIRIGDRATLVRWPRMRHDLFHETGRTEITQRLVSWLDQIGTDDISTDGRDESSRLPPGD